jgi:hypothetical protein
VAASARGALPGAGATGRGMPTRGARRARLVYDLASCRALCVCGTVDQPLPRP